MNEEMSTKREEPFRNILYNIGPNEVLALVNSKRVDVRKVTKTIDTLRKNFLDYMELADFIDSEYKLKKRISNDVFIDVIIKITYITTNKIKLTNKIKDISQARAKVRFEQQTGITKEFNKDIQGLIDQIQSENSKLVDMENKITADIDVLSKQRTLLREKFNTRWSIVLKYTNAYKDVRRENIHLYLESWGNMSNEDQDTFGGFDDYVSYRVKEDGRARQLHLSTDPFFLSKMKMYISQFGAKSEDMSVSRINQILESGDFRFLTESLENISSGVKRQRTETEGQREDEYTA